MSEAAEIVFDHVTKRYAGRDSAAVDDLSLEIPAGAFCILVGPSGGGKTTALKMVTRLIPFDSGEIRIDGRAIESLPVTELRRGIGYVIQQVGLFPHMTAAEKLATVPRLLGWPKRRTRDRVLELLDLVGLEATDAPRYPAALSGGQRQRGGLARAPAGRPRAPPPRPPAAAPDGRAVRRPRPDHARSPADGDEAPPPGGRQDDHLRHARHRRGDPARRPDRDPPARRRARAVRHAGRDSRRACRRLRRAVHRRGPRAAAAGAADARRRPGVRRRCNEGAPAGDDRAECRLA